MTPTLVWFRRDLRLDDNPALAWAAARGPVVPVFIWSPEEEGSSAPGAASRWWLMRSLEALDADLRGRGLSLVIRRGPAAKTLVSLARETGARAAAWGRVWEPGPASQAAAAADALTKAGVEVYEGPANLLFEPGRVMTDDGRPYRVFTPFWNKCGQLPPPPRPAAAPRALRGPARCPSSVDLGALGLVDGHPWSRKLARHWTPGEVSARAALKSFVRKVLPDYPALRQFPGRGGASRLSAHLHFGEVSVRRAWHEAAGPEQRPDEKGGFLGELGWRDFAAHILHHFPRTVESPLDPRFEGFRWRRDPEGLEAWRRGRTGFPLVDAGMRELWETGVMHNRVRMVVASFLCKDLLVDWREGARWFWDTLVDADLANNTLGWQWTAGCGADAAPFFRIFNPDEQARRWDPEGAYVRRWGRPPGSAPARILDHAEARRRALDAFGARRAHAVL